MLGHAELDIEERIAAPVTLEAFTDLITWYQHADYDPDLTNGSIPLSLGWDMRRSFGDAAFETWCDLMHVLEPPLLAADLVGPNDLRQPCTMTQYETALVEQWTGYDRPFYWTDHLIIDAMSRAQNDAWEPCGAPEVVDTIEAVLDDLATRSGAKRAACEAEADRLEAIERAEIDAPFAVYEAWLVAGELSTDPLVEDHRTRKRAVEQFKIDAEYESIMNWSADAEVEGNAFAAEYAAKMAGWEERHGGLVAIRRLYLQDKRIPPGTSVVAMAKLRIAFALPMELLVQMADQGAPISVSSVPHKYHDIMRTLTKPLKWATEDHISRRLEYYDPWSQPEPVPAVPIPAAILDMHKQQSQHYAAAMIGPLPDHPELPMDQANSLSRFWAHLPSGKIIYEGTRDLWSAASTDKHVGRIKDAMNPNSGPGMLASTFLSQHRGVQSMGWDPSEPMIIQGRVLTQEGWITSRGDRTFNRYLPPSIAHIKGDISPWLDHLRNIYPDDVDHVVNWFAHRVQRPGDKVNHALVFLGTAGIGKDTIIEPVTAAIGKHNFQSITAQNFFASEFNGYLKSVMLRIDEVHDLGGESKYAFNDRTKPVIAAPPMMHHINEKFVPHYAAKNVCGVILTSNHRDSLFLSPDDRRHYVCVSDRRKEDLSPGYFDAIYSWFENGGNEAVAHYLANLDIGGFNAKAPPPHTKGWHMLVGAGQAPESGDLADVIEVLGKPAALTIAMIRSRVPMDSPLWHLFQDPKSRTKIPKRLAECGYVAVANPDALDSGGRWRLATGKTVIYALQELSELERLAAARAFSTYPLTPPPPY
jgi:hypothetical protein